MRAPQQGSPPSAGSGTALDWAPGLAVGAFEIRRDPNGVLQRSVSARTTRGTFDTTEQGFWAPLAPAPGAPAVPTAHKSTHATGGTDPLSPADIGAATATDAANNAAAITTETNRAVAAEATKLAATDAKLRSLYQRPTAAIAENMDRDSARTTIAMTSGVLRMTAIPLNAGTVVSALTFLSRATAMAGGTHLWAALYDNTLVPLRQPADDTAPTWAADTAKTFTLASTVTVSYTGLYYAALLEVATTPNDLVASGAAATPIMALAPILTGTSTAGLTATAPNPAAAITASAFRPYVYAS